MDSFQASYKENRIYQLICHGLEIVQHQKPKEYKRTKSRKSNKYQRDFISKKKKKKKLMQQQIVIPSISSVHVHYIPNGSPVDCKAMKVCI